MPHQIKVTDELYDKLKARAGDRPIPALLRELLESPKSTQDEADRLLEELDNPPIDPIAMGLRPGELPECCQLIYKDPEDPTPKCEHWEKAWVNYYGRKVVHYRNKLTGLSYFDYFNKYVGA